MQCYTPWQVGIQVYICICIIPIAFVLSHEVFYVENSRMSVRMFVLTCLFPLPVMTWYHLSSLIVRRKYTLSMSKQDGGSIEVSPSGVDTEESLEMKVNDELKIEDPNDLQNSDIFRARGSIHSFETLEMSDLIWR